MTTRLLPARVVGSFNQLVPRQITATTSLSSRCLQLSRCYSSEPAPPALLSKLKGDLKTAMKAKDAARLTVLRSVIAATLNASKTASPIRTNAQLVALLRKQARSSQEAADEFRDAGREDLVEKEEAQLRVLREYADGSGIESVGEEELRNMVEAVKAELVSEGITGKAATGEAMKRLLAPGGPLDGKDVEKADVVRIIKE
ncbi:Yqey-like protein-domain-containing protein [Phialemonium atrogriseum]|uniref:Altered inheritance of mitochondria protein 41 n=1 Tax=Phialemonium atrogriseum TaxID=1093897 RepID=A0AAJ0C0C3_9PEZI|nr:Yqey-like protein-domain-containing protein [Phialemonium atrogriseum]KAK1766743.1 Yqey-like protein-domain-containing protein [Phialemonium atrogriseum]